VPEKRWQRFVGLTAFLGCSVLFSPMGHPALSPMASLSDLLDGLRHYSAEKAAD
jgi:hypothetical protein